MVDVLLPVAIVISGFLMVIDWWAVTTLRVRVEEIAKPLVMFGLIGVTLGIDAPQDGVRLWVVAALVFGLLGDVFLLPRVDRFIAGLTSFLVGHLLYVVALAKLGPRVELLVVGVFVGGVVLGTVGRRVIAGVVGTALRGPVIAYNLVIVAMVVMAFGSGEPLAIGGALAFAASDAIIGLDRFVLSGASHRLQIMLLYHLGQAGLVAGIVAPFT